MDWTSLLAKAIDYIETHLLEPLTNEQIAQSVSISSFYFQKSFSIYTGYNVSEYIRSRRLYKAALEMQNSNTKIIDIALKYGYETPEAFSKAFTRFHGSTPSQICKKEGHIKPFLPLKIKIIIQGGYDMNYRVEQESELTFIGFKKVIKDGEGYKECPSFWREIAEKYINRKSDDTPIAKAITDNMIGAFAICVPNGNCEFSYYICGKYQGGEIPEGLETFSIKKSLWAKFTCVGPLPGALQSVNTKIWNEWVPNNKEYELNFETDIEYYTDGDTDSQDYISEIWIPVKPIK